MNRTNNFDQSLSGIDPVIVIKALILNFVRTSRFWNNLHPVRSISKYWNDKYLNSALE